MAKGDNDDHRADDEWGVNRPFYLPRLPREYYQADAVVHWTLPVAHRGQGWLSPSFQCGFRELILHCAAREDLICPTYCLMPDHLHLVWMGLDRDTDQRNGMAFLRTHLQPLLAPHTFENQAHDHVLKENERRRNAFAAVCYYILENPVRAGLVQSPGQWQFHGAILPGYPRMHPLNEEFWRRFWEIYSNAKKPGSGNILRPPLH